MKFLSDKINATQKLATAYKPDFFRIGEKASREQFLAVVEQPGVMVYDEIYSQLKELIKSRNPKKRFTDSEYDAEITKHLKGKKIEEYGVWVFYPWSNRMVHMLDEAEFIDLRTSANRQKITTKERDLLATKKIGVIGLSVGQSVSVTLAMERGCGELRLADFDTLELNNLNRIRTGCHNLGVYKAYSVAREIAELDPYFKVVCYTDGITDENIYNFFTNGGKLDAVIDECDGVNVKIQCRMVAKELHVPVLMEASDRGTLDIERFDLDPQRPIMHGWLKHLPINMEVLKNLNTPDQKLEYILPISGLETLSSRMKASMVEIQNSITTWPQLATAVTLGGAITADTCRRIFLNQFTDSGRYFIDMENLVRDIRPKTEYEPSEEHRLLDDKTMISIARKATAQLEPTDFCPEPSELRKLIHEAIKAPSPGNIQPWKWVMVDNFLCLFAETEDLYPYETTHNASQFMACGAAIENLELEARRKNIGLEIVFAPLEKQPKLAAVIKFIEDGAGAPQFTGHDDLVNYISYRSTNRNIGSGKGIPRDRYEKLKNVVRSVDGMSLQIVDYEEELATIANIVGASERIKLLTPASHHEYFKTIRWSNDECIRTSDGIHIDQLGLSKMEIIMHKMLKKQEVGQLLSDWNGGQALEYGIKSKILSSFAVGLLTIPESSTKNYILAGKAMERMWLAATKYDVAIQPLNDSILQFNHASASRNSLIPKHLKQEIQVNRNAFSSVFNELENKTPAFLFRMSVAERPLNKTYRKQIEKVTIIHSNK